MTEQGSKNQLEAGKLVLEIESEEAGTLEFIFEQEESDRHPVTGIISCDTAVLISADQEPKPRKGGMATLVWLHAYLQTALGWKRKPLFDSTVRQISGFTFQGASTTRELKAGHCWEGRKVAKQDLPSSSLKQS